MTACKSCGYPVPAISVGKGYRAFCPSCRQTTPVFYRESEAVDAWEKMNAVEEPVIEEKPVTEKKPPKKAAAKSKK